MSQQNTFSLPKTPTLDLNVTVAVVNAEALNGFGRVTCADSFQRKKASSGGSHLQYYQREVGLLILHFVTARNSQGQRCQIAAGSELIGEIRHRQTQVRPYYRNTVTADWSSPYCL